MPQGLTDEGYAEFVVDRSRFVGLSVSLKTAAAYPALQAIQQRLADATHYCYAFRWTAGEERADDAGEPQGTAGIPILSVLRQQDLIHTMVVVARCYGGIKLGRQGLYRAYRTVAEQAVAAGHPLPLRTLVRLRIAMDYSAYDQFRHWLTPMPHQETREPWFDTKAHWEGWVEGRPPTIVDALEKTVSQNLTADVLDTREGVLRPNRTSAG